MAYILLVRHGENEWVKEHRLAGWIEGIHLNENGRQQAEQAAVRLAHLPLTAIYSSPVERCRETAEFIAQTHQLPIQLLLAVGEVRYGDWEGADIKELAKSLTFALNVLVTVKFPSQSPVGNVYEVPS